MGTIRDELQLTKQFKFKDFDGDYGVEIETETKNEGSYPEGIIKQKSDGSWHTMDELARDWMIHHDGSLRNFGQEYVLTEPLSFERTLKALKDFGKITKDVRWIENAPGTSVHVHTNMLNRTFIEAGNYLTTWVLYENLLVEYCGPPRRSNLFALPVRCAEETYITIQKMFARIEEGDYKALVISEQNSKYAAMNLARLGIFGSLEARCFRGTTNVSEIIEWVSILEKIRKYSMTPGLTPKYLLEEYRYNPHELFSNIFGDYTRVLARQVPNPEAWIERNLWYAAEIAGSVRDWNNLLTPFSSRIKDEPKKESRKKKLTEFIDEYQPVQPGAALYMNTFVQMAHAPAQPAPQWQVIDDFGDGPPHFGEPEE